MADKGASKPRAVLLGHNLTRKRLREATFEVGRAVEKMLAEAAKPDEKAAAVVEEKLCAHSAQEGIGTKGVGYALPEMGPFLCANCVHVSKNGTRCDHPEVIADPDVPKDGKLAVVRPSACCNEFHPVDTE